jgi:hypothetical protein
MELGVLLLAPLASDVASDLAFATVLADRTEVGPFGPELPTPQELLDGGDPPEDFSGGESLDDPGEFAGAVGRNRLHEEVHVVPVGPDLQKRNVVPGGNLQTDVPEGRVHLGGEHRPAVLRGADQMVEQDGDIVATVDVFAHTPSLPHGPDAASRGVSTLKE